jgi:hypothetical protein
METNKKRLAQDIDIDNNPVIDNDIIPEDKDIKETTPTPVITEEEINTNTMIESIIEPNPEFEDNVVDTPTTAEAVPEPVIERPRNTVRYIDGGFTF